MAELTTQESIDVILTNFAEFLKEKNRRYGDSAVAPINIFSKLPAGEQILIRLDDKVSRIKNSDQELGYIAEERRGRCSWLRRVANGVARVDRV